MKTFLLTCFPGLQTIMCLAQDDENKTPYLTGHIEVEFNQFTNAL
jgi:hypothetical protein